MTDTSGTSVNLVTLFISNIKQTLPEHLGSHLLFSGVRVIRFYVYVL